ncbi:SUMO-conjugating enzyme SCE1 [Ananas comosus]|uniref:SUMO-conjugating enzyme SCE1 n=1 Tax=Ananas comosus TaxID=4615 RepID=A0A199V7R0_ANACO|nr:SUMO-conjugating enzyme SCE1 [Ananas comosus]
MFLLEQCAFQFLTEDSGWRRPLRSNNSCGNQDLLDQPNPADPAQTDGYQLFIQGLEAFLSFANAYFYSHSKESVLKAGQDIEEYKRRVRQQAKQYPPVLS